MHHRLFLFLHIGDNQANIVIPENGEEIYPDKRRYRFRSWIYWFDIFFHCFILDFWAGIESKRNLDRAFGPQWRRAMGSDQNYSLLWLWVLQVAWALAAWLPLALVAILIALAIRWLHYRAKSIEGKKVEPGFVGFLKIIRDYTTHLTIGKAMFHSISAPRSCARDEGRSLEVGLQGLASNHLKLLW
jgi:hypothetical protein